MCTKKDDKRTLNTQDIELQKVVVQVYENSIYCRSEGKCSQRGKKISGKVGGTIGHWEVLDWVCEGGRGERRGGGMFEKRELSYRGR